MWQRLQEELSGEQFTVVAVAFDSRGMATAGPWIEQANPTYPCLIDRQHLLAERYGLHNVPMAVWIDEEGMIVRGPEPAGASDAFRQMDRQTFAIPEEARSELRKRRSRYWDALRDWVRNGAASRFVARYAAPQAPTPEYREGVVRFTLGQYLYQAGREDEAQGLLEQAKQLAPDSWAIKRQSWALEDPAKAGGPEYWAAVDALGDRRYYPEIALDED